MKLFIIRHKSTGKIMPLMKKARGYSHWNPNNEFAPKLHMEEDVPRFLISEKKAKNAINGWYNYPNAKNDIDGDIDIKRDDRKKEDLEIVEVIILSALGGKL